MKSVSAGLPYWTDDPRPICGEQMANDMRRRSGRICGRTEGHTGAHRSTYAIGLARIRRAAEGETVRDA